MEKSVEDIIGKDLTEMLKEAVTNKTYENNSVFYTGKIINNDDPEKLGRCQIRVYGVFNDEIPDDDLPWATPDFSFNGSDIGSFIVPKEDTLVNVYFDNDDIYLPKYTSKVLQKKSLADSSAGYNIDYPDTMVFFETDMGDYFKINRRTNTATFRHASGLMVTITADGNCSINAHNAENSSINLTASNSINLVSSKDVVISSSEKILITTAEGDTAKWMPNTIPVCPYTAQPHGGPLGGIKSLSGGGY